MALLTALFATALLMGLGLSVLLLGSAETALAARDRDSRALGQAARAAASVAAADLRALPSWAALATPGVAPEVSATPGQLIDSTLTPAAPWGGGGVLDLRALTARLQADTDAAAAPGTAPAWRLFAYGPLARLVPESSPGNPYYLVVWIAGEGNAVVTRSVAYGPGDGRSITEASLVRETGTNLVRILTIRPGS
jgi:hypothetical protein